MKHLEYDRFMLSWPGMITVSIFAPLTGRSNNPIYHEDPRGCDVSPCVASGLVGESLDSSTEVSKAFRIYHVNIPVPHTHKCVTAPCYKSHPQSSNRSHARGGVVATTPLLEWVEDASISPSSGDHINMWPL